MASSKPISLRLASVEDIPGCMRVLSRAFQHNAPFVDVFYPNHDTPEGQEYAVSAFTQYWQSYSSKSDLVVAVTNNEVAGFALWTYMSRSMNLSPPELDATPFAKNEEDSLFAKQLWKSYIVPRRSAVFEADEKNPGHGIWVLEYLAVDPAHQRKGAGKGLVRWGLDNARKEGTWAIVEATPAGEPCYKNCGFIPEIQKMQFVVDEQFGGRRLPELAFMRHDCK